MTETDTIKIRMLISSCTQNSTEKLTISKSKDSLIITTELKENTYSNDDFKKQYVIKINENDSTWKLGDFIKKYKSENIKDKESLFLIQSDTTKIKIYTKGIIDRDNIVADYCIMMRKLFPKSEYHFYGELVEIDN